MSNTSSQNAGLDPARHCTLEMYAAAKNLPVDFLQSLRIRTVEHPYDPTRVAMEIPYVHSDGAPHRSRLRVTLSTAPSEKDDRFRWDRQPDGTGTIMYGLDRLKNDFGNADHKHLLLVEGESDCHAGWLHGRRVLGLPGAANYKPKRDDQHLVGECSICAIIEPGQGGRAMIRRLSLSAHRSRIKLASLQPIKDLSALHLHDADKFDEKLDAAINVAVSLDAYLDEHPGLDDALDKFDPPPPAGLRRDKFGNIECRAQSKEEAGDTGEEEGWTWFCSPIRCLGKARDGDGRSWSRVFSILDSDGTWHEVVIKMELLAGKGDELLRLLFDHGFRIAHGRAARDTLMYLIGKWRTRTLVRIVSRLGWHGRAYVRPDTVLGETHGERIVIAPGTPISPRLKTKGDLKSWQDQLAALAVGNSRLAFVLCVPFVGPLLQLVGRESRGAHLVGSSSIGKTALAVAAGSVTGGGQNGNVSPWRTTDNGAELLAASSNDGSIIFDELGQVDAHAAAKIIYMIGNGQSKVRADRNVSLRTGHEWHVAFLSTGEMTLEAKLQEAKLRIMAGQEVRFLSLPADAGAQLGAFEVLHDHSSAAAFADHLKASAAEHHGVAIVEFLTRLTADMEGGREFILASEVQFVERYCPVDAGGQVRRVYGWFALAAAAGELAVKYGVLPWPEGEAVRGVAACAAAWLAERGGVDQAEVIRGVASVRKFIQAHETERFADIETWANKIPRRAGFIRRKDGLVEYMFFDEAFREACGGVDPALVAEQLRRDGCLDPGEGSRLKKKVRLPRLGTDGPRGPQQRFYVVTSKLLETDADAEATGTDTSTRPSSATAGDARDHGKPQASE